MKYILLLCLHLVYSQGERSKIFSIDPEKTVSLIDNFEKNSCPCDLTENSCDRYCCCDPECDKVTS